MEESERIKKQRELIERIGRNNERDGFQPVTARILGLLMVMDKEEYTFDEIVDEMQISKSSASNALRNLELRGVIEYVTYPGDRKRYFRFVSGDINEIIAEIEKRTKHIKTPLDVSVMGCVVNAIGEAKSADVAIAFGKGSGLVMKKGEIIAKLSGDALINKFIEEVEIEAEKRK